MPEREGFGGEIERVTIPDEAMPGWIEVLHKSGLDQEATDWFLARMNSTYAKAKGIPDVEGAVADLESYMEKEYGRSMTAEQREYARRAIEQTLENKKNSGN